MPGDHRCRPSGSPRTPFRLLCPSCPAPPPTTASARRRRAGNAGLWAGGAWRSPTGGSPESSLPEVACESLCSMYVLIPRSESTIRIAGGGCYISPEISASVVDLRQRPRRRQSGPRSRRRRAPCRDTDNPSVLRSVFFQGSDRVGVGGLATALRLRLAAVGLRAQPSAVAARLLFFDLGNWRFGEQ